MGLRAHRGATRSFWDGQANGGKVHGHRQGWGVQLELVWAAYADRHLDICDPLLCTGYHHVPQLSSQRRAMCVHSWTGTRHSAVEQSGAQQRVVWR